VDELTLLTIQGSSWIEEISEQMMNAAREAFEGQNVEVDYYYNEFNTEESLLDLSNRAQRSVQVLFDFMKATPRIDIGERSSTDRIQSEIDTVGFYVAVSSLRDDRGVTRKHNCFRAITQLRRRFSQFKVSVTVDINGGKNEFMLRILDIDRVPEIPFLSVYLIQWELDIKSIDLQWQKPA